MTPISSGLHAARPRRPIAVLCALLLATLVLALAGCGSSSSGSSSSSGGSAPSQTTTTHFAKTKFVFHAGLAFGAFHHWIWKPFRAGDFSHPFAHKLTLIKAGLAAGFTYHELKLALHDAQADPTLSKLVSPLTALENRLHGLPSEVKGGNAGTLASDNSSIDAIKSRSASSGQPINEQVPAAP